MRRSGNHTFLCKKRHFFCCQPTSCNKKIWNMITHQNDTLNRLLVDHSAATKNVDVFLTPRTNLKLSKSYCTSIEHYKTYFKRWIVYCSKCKRSSRNQLFVKIKSYLTPRITRIFLKHFQKQHVTQNQTSRFHFIGL